jgi:hypothetical protein
MYPDKMQAMQGQYGHLNNCKEYTRQKVVRNVLANQFPVIENGPFEAMMQMEEYLNMYAPDEDEQNKIGVDEARRDSNESEKDDGAGKDRSRDMAGMDEAEGNNHEMDNMAGMDEAEGNNHEMDNEAERDGAGVDEAGSNENEVGIHFHGSNENEVGIHFQNLLLENLYNYFGHARQRRPNRSKEDIEAGKTVNFVNNRTSARLFCYSTEWQLPAEGLFSKQTSFYVTNIYNRNN